MEPSVAEFRRFLGARAIGRSDAQLEKALLAAGRQPSLLDEAPDVRQFTDWQCGASASCCCGMIRGVGPGAGLWPRYRNDWQTPLVQRKVKRAVEEWSDLLGTTVERSTALAAIVEAFRSFGCQVEAREGMTIADLDGYTRRGWPVIVCVQDWSGVRDPRARWRYGHYLTVLAIACGSRVICQDSSIENAEYEPGGDVPKRHAETEGNIAEPGRIIVRADTWIREWHDRGEDGTAFVHFGIAIGPAADGIRSPAVQKARWDSSKHPRGGHAENPGEFSSALGNNGHKVETAPDRFPSLPIHPVARDNLNQRTRSHPAPDPAATHSTPHDVRPTPPDYQPARGSNGQSVPPSASGHSSLHKSLEKKRMTRAVDLSSGINRSLLLTLEDGTRGIFKPESGERSAPKTAWRREIAASRVADLLGFGDLVPPTTVREQAGEGIGSMQVYVEGALEAANKAVFEPFDGHEDAARAAVFDYLMGNVDRHYGNWLLKDGKIVLIDNGAALPVTKAGTYVPQPNFWIRAVRADLPLPDLSGWTNRWGEVEAVLRECGIEDKAIQLTQRRFEALLRARSGRFADLPYGGFETDGSMGKQINRMFPQR